MMEKAWKIMGLETSAAMGRVALGEGSQVLVEKEFTAYQKHAGELLPTMEALVRGQGWEIGDLDHLYVSAGPGSFTGLRIGITVAKVLGFAQVTKIVPVVSTEAAVLNIDEDLPAKYGAVVIDAKRKGVYAAVYERVASGGLAGSYIPGWRCVMEPRIMTAAELMNCEYRPMHIL
ncbi:MAG: tRNA (adenosine(37)-N6)-threonylcarbamoyltransferase complex dimerization subunit type 1 TsaB, partial [Planctomycetes bacterium]|nr:tRNA (adenosine(37)-N6)-threonylcarbamoyltransferase complex dimerization subunit type 1 TsaB [Planctomycetota bacterium]